MFKSLTWIGCIVFQIGSLTAQSDSLRYFGWVDDVFAINLAVVIDDKGIVSGRYNIDDKTNYRLTGRVVRDTFFLAEIDPEENLSGYLRLIRTGSDIVGTWEHVDGLLTSEIQLVADKGQYMRKNSSGNKWIKKMHHHALESDWILMRLANNQVYGYVEDEEGVSHDIYGKCLDVWCTQMEIYPGQYVEGLVTFEGRNAIFEDVKGEVRPLKFVDSWSVLCRTDLDYYGSIDIMYPNFDDKLTALMESKVDEWLARWKHISTYEFDHEARYVNDRWTNRYYGWLTIDFISDHFISGVVELIGPDGAEDAVVFNFDKDNEAFLELSDILKRDGEILSEVSPEESDYLTFRKYGLQFRTGFDVVTGRKESLVTYDGRRKLFKRKFLDLIEEQ